MDADLGVVLLDRGVRVHRFPRRPGRPLGIRAKRDRGEQRLDLPHPPSEDRVLRLMASLDHREIDLFRVLLDVECRTFETHQCVNSFATYCSTGVGSKTSSTNKFMPTRPMRIGSTTSVMSSQRSRSRAPSVRLRSL